MSTVMTGLGAGRNIVASAGVGLWSGGQSYAILGKTWADSDLALDIVNAPAAEIGDALDKEHTFVRLRGFSSFRAFGAGGSDTPGDPGYTATWLVRTGFIVLQSDGNLGIPTVTLQGGDSADTEANWLTTDQFLIEGVGTIGVPPFEHTGQKDGNNHYAITREYDVVAKRRLDRNDILVYRIDYCLWDLDGANLSPSSIHVSFSAFMRILSVGSVP